MVHKGLPKISIAFHKQHSSCFTLDFYHVLSNFWILAFLNLTNLTLSFLYDFELVSFVLLSLNSSVPLSFQNTNPYISGDNLAWIIRTLYYHTDTNICSNDIKQYISAVLSLYSSKICSYFWIRANGQSVKKITWKNSQHHEPRGI